MICGDSDGNSVYSLDSYDPESQRQEWYIPSFVDAEVASIDTATKDLVIQTGKDSFEQNIYL